MYFAEALLTEDLTPLRQRLLLTTEQVAFFTAHKEIGEHVQPLDERILQRYNQPEHRRRITRTIRLSHEFEAMFYDTIVGAPLRQGMVHRKAGACKVTPYRRQVKKG